MREESLIRKVKLISEGYTFSQPFANYLKEHFRNHPEMGARDRRETRGWSFNLLRIGKNLQELPFENRLSVACFLCSNDIYPSLTYLLNNYSSFLEGDLKKTLEVKINIVQDKYSSFNPEKIFQMFDLLSPQISKNEWFLSFLKKPKVWIRIRKKFRDDVICEFMEKNISFTPDDDPLILSFEPDVSLDKTISYQNGLFEVQDKYSQLTREYFQPKSNEYWWDACAGAGGKSLLLKEEGTNVRIFATDIRENILRTYVERMKKSGYPAPAANILDLSSQLTNFSGKNFDGIITDVPCSGSGTWSRSPEWLLAIPDNKLSEHYIPLQRKIVSNVFPYLKVGFPLIYITCSVFKNENEENIEYFLNNLPLKLEKTAYLHGYKSRADTLFIARFIKIH